MRRRVVVIEAILAAEREELRVLSGELAGFTFDPLSGEWTRESDEDGRRSKKVEDDGSNL